MVQTSEFGSFPSFHKRFDHIYSIHPIGNSDRCWVVDKTIKLWKVFEKQLRVVSESNHHDGQRALPPPASRNHLRLPRMTLQDNIIAAVPRKVYSNAHAYHIHSISVNSDQETYISADDLRINLWNLEVSDRSFSALCLLYSCVLY